MKLSRKMGSYTIYFVLLFTVIFLFIVLNISSNAMYIDLFGERVKADKNVLMKENNEYYLSYEFVKENLDSEIYFDNISKKVVISSDKGLFKAKINEKSISVNFENKDMNNIGVIEQEDRYISLEVLKLGYDIDITVCNNTIYIYENNNFAAKAKNNNVRVYVDSNLKSKIVNYVDKKDKISVICEKGEFALIEINDKEVGYVSNDLLDYTIKKLDNTTETLKDGVYIFADYNNKNIDSGMPINGVLVDMFEITQVSAVVNEKDISNSFLNSIKSNGYKLYGIVSNGYNLSGFNTATMSQILADENKRLNLINNLSNKIEEYNLDGIVLDFRRLKEKDIPNYIQFIKEFKAFTNKQVVLNAAATEYKNYISVINYSDFCIINAYGQRDLNSSVAGSVAEISWMEDMIETILQSANNKKVVVGIPAYSILWTEKNSNVVDSEIYNLKAIADYVKRNNLEVKEVNRQNYIELKKGSLIYRMWLEDELSIKNRLKIIKDNNLMGVAIYKLGYENDILINALKNN